MKLLTAEFTKEYRQGMKIDINWQIPLNEFSLTVVCGPSGSGKTTFLRCLAGLENISSGFIKADNVIWSESITKISISPQERKTGFCFQDYALFPHLTVEQNIAFSHPQRRLEVLELLEKFELKNFAHRYPHQISGGEQQRVALARAVFYKPQILLLDEPLSALDQQLKICMRREIRQMLSTSNIPVVMVSHDRNDALALADQMMVFHQGKILMQGPVEEVFTRPATPAVADIVGIETVINGEIIKIEEGMAIVRVGNVELLAVAPMGNCCKVHLCIRGEDVVLTRREHENVSSRNQLLCRVTDIMNEGPLIRVSLDCGFKLSALITKQSAQELKITPGEKVTALIKVPAIHLIPC